MLARALEATGLPTTSLALVKEHAQRTKPPRALFVPFAYGYALGKPDDPEFQHRVIAAALDLFQAPSGPVLAEFPESGDAPARLVQASALDAKSRNLEQDPADELTAMRGYYERWVEEHSGRTAVGVTGVPQRQFRGVVRFLQGYLSGEASDFAQRPAEVGVPHFIRLCADDLKAFLLEARMCQRPGDRDNALQEWFWGETAVGGLLARVSARLQEQGEDRVASGIAR